MRCVDCECLIINKITGDAGTGTKGALILRAQGIKRKILAKTAMKAVGGSDDDEDEGETVGFGAGDDFDIGAAAEETNVEEATGEEQEKPTKKARKEDTKSKNCKAQSTPRASAAGALNNLANALAVKASSSSSSSSSSEKTNQMLAVMIQQNQMFMMLMARQFGAGNSFGTPSPASSSGEQGEEKNNA